MLEGKNYRQCEVSMPNRLELPEELQNLIEKREGEERRQDSSSAEVAADPADRRTGEDRRSSEG